MMELLANIDYQMVINAVGIILIVSTPIGILFGIAGKLVNMFMSMVTGSKRVKL